MVNGSAHDQRKMKIAFIVRSQISRFAAKATKGDICFMGAAGAARHSGLSWHNLRTSAARPRLPGDRAGQDTTGAARLLTQN